MHSEPTAHTIAGGWLGTYYYSNGFHQPVRFEATFSLTNRMGGFGGRILDDNHLGEANVVNGVHQGTNIIFTKVYIRLPKGSSYTPITYEGLMSEDGQRLNGKWFADATIPSSGRTIRFEGRWDAHRLWTEKADSVENLEPEIIQRELVTVGGR